MSALTPRFTITNTITAGLTAIERARGFLEAATLSDDWLQRMSQRALLLECSTKGCCAKWATAHRSQRHYVPEDL